MTLLAPCVFAAIRGGGELVRSTGIKRTGSNIVVNFDAVSNSSYRLERKPELTNGAWQSIPGVNEFTAISNGAGQIVDTNAANLSKAFYRVNLVGCDAGLTSNSANPFDYAKAMDLCETTTEGGTNPGVISATLTLTSGTGTPAVVSRAIRTSFGNNNLPRSGASFVVLSTGAAAAPGQVNPSYMAFQPGLSTGTSSAPPADWLAANGGKLPNAPGCPTPMGSTVRDPVMLTLRLRVPSYAHSFKVSAKFFSSEFPEWVCSPYNDFFVALLDSTYNGIPANPADKNLAVYIAPDSNRYPLGVNLASGNTGLFNDCVNGTTGCEPGGIAGSINTCSGTNGLTGTGFDVAASGKCNANSLVGGATAWLTIRGNVVPNEIITLRFAIWDTSDGTYDSLVLLDNFAWSGETVTPGTTAE